MTVPTRAEALALLLSAQPSQRLLQHVTVVAEVASFLAHRAGRAGLAVDRRLIETAALLHDIDKALPADDPVRELGHGRAGAAWLRAAGHPELARPIAAHPVMQLDDPAAHEWLESAPLEDRIVCYADKRATQRVVSLDQRFARWERRHPEYADRLRATLVLARQLEADICAALRIRPEDVERLPWVADAMSRARAADPDATTDRDGRTPFTGQALSAEPSTEERVPVGPRRLA
jgi:putative nucleotidyltransferase with HDIG domain